MFLKEKENNNQPYNFEIKTNCIWSNEIHYLYQKLELMLF